MHVDGVGRALARPYGRLRLWESAAGVARRPRPEGGVECSRRCPFLSFAGVGEGQGYVEWSQPDQPSGRLRSLSPPPAPLQPTHSDSPESSCRRRRQSRRCPWSCQTDHFDWLQAHLSSDSMRFSTSSAPAAPSSMTARSTPLSASTDCVSSSARVPRPEQAERRLTKASECPRRGPERLADEYWHLRVRLLHGRVRGLDEGAAGSRA